jgi:hypothetical protein
MTDPALIRAGLKAALSTSAFTDAQFMAQDYFSIPVANVIQFMPDGITYDRTGSRGTDEWTWVVQAFVAANIEKAAQMRLDQLLASSGGLSIKAALEVDSTLGGAVDDLRVISAKGHQLFETARGVALGSTWTVHMLASGE